MLNIAVPKKILNIKSYIKVRIPRVGGGGVLANNCQKATVLTIKNQQYMYVMILAYTYTIYHSFWLFENNF